MKIISIVTQMEGGGAQSAAMRLSQGLRGRGYQTEVWFLYLKRPTYVGEKAVRVLLNRPPGNFLDYISVFERLTRDLRRERPQVVITFTHYANILGQIAAFLAGVQCRIASQRNPSWTYPKIARLLDHLLGTAGLFKANVMVSHAAKDTFEDYTENYRKRVSVVHNGIDFVSSCNSPKKSRNHFSLPTDVPMIVTVGRLSEQKNHSVLIRALVQLQKVHLAIAGDGELRGELEAMVKRHGLQERVHFLGEISPSKIPDFLNSADVFVMPSRYEGLSNALLEAISASLPVIASDIPTQAEVIGTGGEKSCGFLVPPDDVEGWVAAIKKTFGNQEIRNEFAKRAKKRSRDFTTERMIDGFEHIIGGGIK